jgi:UDP:flavonoid glycosyltransferase YjiC (YdhE family)
MDEQLFWARLLQRLKLADRPLPAKKVNSRDLAKVLKTVLERGELRQNAQQASILMKNQTGVSNAVQLIETYIALKKEDL